MAVETIRALPIWTGDVEIEPLEGGITNRNYRVTDGDRVYAVREGEDDPLLGISRHNEVACARFAARHGLAPAIVHSSPGISVADFVAGAPLTPELAREPDRIRRVARHLRAVHDAGVELPGPVQYFSPFQVAFHYLDVAGERDLALPSGVGAIALRQRIVDLQARVGAFVPAFCHNDLMPANLLDDGQRIALIDWEYAGVGHPCFDLAGYASNCDFDAEQADALRAAYFDGDADPWAAAFPIMRAMAALRECLWAVVQGSQSSIDFDYEAYRDDSWARFAFALDAMEEAR